MASKIRDIVAKVSEYQDPRSGQTKGRYVNVGALMKGDNGDEFILLNQWINLAGLPSKGNSVILSCFKTGNNGQDQQPQYQQPQYQQPQYQKNNKPQIPFPNPDDDIPF